MKHPTTSEVRPVVDYIYASWDQSVRHHPAADNVEPVPFPYTSPCIDDTFIALYYWDTYFTNLGLIYQDRTELARSNCDTLAWLVEQKGKVPNSIFVEDDTRSQPPYLAMMVQDVFEVTRDTQWLSEKIPLLYQEYHFWEQERMTPIGLNRHFHDSPPEYLLKFYDRYGVPRLGLPQNAPAQVKQETAIRLIAEAETGWDFNPRFSKDCPSYAPIDLNTNLALYETIIPQLESALGNHQTQSGWEKRHHKRTQLINNHLWSEECGMYKDFNWKTRQLSNASSVATFQPLWAGIASPEQAAAVQQNLSRFEMEHGLSVTEKTDPPTGEQWAWPNGWPPTTWIAIKGLSRYGYDDDARRLALKYINLTTHLFSSTTRLWEKHDVVSGTIAGGEYKANTMLGWSAGVFIACCHHLKLI